jgi:hypothetical protein
MGKGGSMSKFEYCSALSGLRFYLNSIQYRLLLLAFFFIPRFAMAGSPEKMVILTSPQTLVVGTCSEVVRAQSQDSSSKPAPVKRNMTVYFTGSNSSLRFFSDPTCLNAVDQVKMLAGTAEVKFYFSSKAVGLKKMIVATYNLVDDSQFENIVSAPSPSPSPSPEPSPTPTVTPSPSPSPTNPGELPSPIYGVTTDSVSNLSGIVQSLQNLSHKPTTRIVFDEYIPATQYVEAVSKISPVSYIMGEILDSFYVRQYTVTDYLARATEYISTFGNKVDLWEIGNEVNGEWLGDTSSVVAKISGAYQVAKQNGVRTVLTLYYNQDCWSKADHEMFTWTRNNISSELKQGLDYVLVSYYEDDCNQLQPDWQAVFQELGEIFPNSKIGMGEVGTTNSQLKASYIQRYYTMKIDHPRYIGGYFWWYFRQDMVPYTSTLWGVLNESIK